MASFGRRAPMRRAASVLGGEPYRALAAHAAAAGVIVFVCVFLWGVTGGGAFWPGAVFFSLANLVAIHAILETWRVHPGSHARGLTLSGGIGGSVCVLCFGLWLSGGGGYAWWLWVWLGIGLAVGVHALIAYRDAWLPGPRSGELAARVDTLERTRRGALDVQAEQLRRIERDLHDGAQARLVALSMHLGRAEERLEDRPETAALVRAAREEAGNAIAELRDLARGIAPPVLADRGLGAALDALGRRAAMPVGVDVELRERLAPVVEAAVYFVVAEALTNVAKHAPGARATVRVWRVHDVLHAEVRDDGPGGAVTLGSGLTGLRHRVEALDGRLTVDSPPGGGTIVEAELPCES
jgi:signal transduction histidine kinase